MRIYVATKNQHKVHELQQLIDFAKVELSTLPDGLPDAIEDGATFAENARAKALFYAQFVDDAVLSDDSGLVVPLLNGDPGIYSARYAGTPSDDEKNKKKLMTELQHHQVNQAPAYFACALTICRKDTILVEVEGRVPGTVYDEQLGAEGFGYDPLFQPFGSNLRYGQMSMAEKSRTSHRAVAVQLLSERQAEWLDK